LTPASTRSLHVLFVNEFYWPDVCASAAVLMDQLPVMAELRPDWRISVLAGDRAWDRPAVRWPKLERHGAIEVVRAPRGEVRRSLLGRARGFWRFHRGAIRLGRTLERVDVVVSSTAPPLGGRIGRAIARAHGARHVYKVLDLYPDCAEALGVISPGGVVARAWRGADTSVMRDAAAVVTIADRMADWVRATRGLDASRVTAIHDGIDPARVTFSGENRFRREQGLADKFVVQYAGNMGLSHPFETILRAAEELAGEKDVVFQFIGAGPGRSEIERTAAAGRARIQLLGYQPAESLAEMLAAADVALISQHPALFDQALPHKVYAALAAGRPAVFVGSRRSEIAEWFSEQDCGRQIDPGDVNGLVDAIRGLKSDRAAAAARGERGRQLLVGRFTHRLAAERWVGLIEKVAGQYCD